MALVKLPVNSDRLRYSFDVALEGASYTLQIQWIERESAWYFDLLAGDGTELAMGRKLVCNIDLLRELVGETLPPGQLMALDTSGAGTPPGRLDLGSRVVLLYNEAT
jgi:hypothetical protein